MLACVDDDGTVTGDLDEAVAATVRGTLRFVRRQRRWFRRDPRIRWLDGADRAALDHVLRYVGRWSEPLDPYAR